jgi:Na+-transporting methylmalonyl-CoA/oxaloacetate decarboxylase beta subunit
MHVVEEFETTNRNGEEPSMDIGVIGGADGPTVIFVSSNFHWVAITAIVILAFTAAGLIIWKLIKNCG